MPIFFELALILVIAVTLSFILRAFKQPLILAYIFTGIIVGPSALNLLGAHEILEVFSQFGITILLFIVGIHLSPNIIKQVGKVSSVAGVGQVLFTSIIGFGIAWLLKFSPLEAAYLCVALAFSSTIIVLKLLADRGDLQTLYGRISIGILLVQDVIAAVILILITALTHASSAGLAASLSDTLLKGVGLTLLLIIISRYVLPKITSVASKNSELLFMFSLSWGLGVAALFALLGFSTEIGALVAGVSLASSDFTEEISARMRPLRDFFITLFFILLGSQLVPGDSLALITPVILLSLFVLIGNPIIVMILMNLLGYERKTGFMTGLTVAQISEFSLILISFGAKLGHLSPTVVTITTLVGLITIAGSTYLFLYADKLFSVLSPALGFLEWRKRTKQSTKKQPQYEILLFGCDDLGIQLLPHFVRDCKQFAVVDYNPEVLEKLKLSNYPHFFGDASNIEFLQELPLASVKLIFSNIPDLETNCMLLKFIKTKHPSCNVVVTARFASDALKLYDAGATYVVWSHAVGAEHIQRILSKFGHSFSGFGRYKEQELHKLESFLYS